MLSRDKGIGLLIVFLFVGSLIGNMVGVILGLVFDLADVSQDRVVYEVLVSPLVAYKFGPLPINLILLSFTFGFELHFNLPSIAGLLLAWYYYKYSY